MGVIGRWLGSARDLTLNEYLRRAIEPTWAGMSVTPESALQVSAVFACVRVIAEDIGKLPFVVYQQNGDRERVRAVNSPFWRLLHDRPNSYQTSQQFREYLTSCALLRGNGFALKTVAQGQVRELHPIHPDNVRMELDDDYELIYHVTMRDGTERALTRAEVFHLPSLAMVGPFGVSVLTQARQTIGNALGAARHAGTFFGNGMKPSGVLKHKGRLSEDAQKRLKAQLEDVSGGAKSNSLVVLEDGLDFSPVSLSNQDSQFLESRAFEVVEICRWFGVKPHKIADLTRATFSNVEQQAKEHVSDTLLPWGVRWEGAVNQQVIVTNAIYAELLYDALLQGTTLERYQAYQLAAGGNAPFMTRNEIRRRENLSPLPGLDEMLVPLNMSGSAGTGGDNGNAAAA